MSDISRLEKIEGQSFTSRFTRQISHRLRTRNLSLTVGFVIVALFVLAAILAPILTHENPNAMDLSRRLDPPGKGSLLGRDELGRDIFTRMLYGAQLSLTVVTLAVAMGAVIGTLLGTASGYRGGIPDEIIMRGADVMLSFPRMLLAIILAAIIGPSVLTVTLAVGLPDIPRFARVARAGVLAVKQNEFVEAATAIGESSTSVAFRYVLPNLFGAITTYASLSMASGILMISGLSFLGLGIPPPTAEWGSMIAAGREYLRVAPYLATIPGLAITAVVLGFNLLGDAIRDLLDPRLRGA